ncbi:hypothetical protein M1555_03320 [Patescibacteria group bacterium]|nr:hypothetical protein [Patescibacteria group bacterium]
MERRKMRRRLRKERWLADIATLMLSDQTKDDLRRKIHHYLTEEVADADGNPMTREQIAMNTVGNVLCSLPTQILYGHITEEEARARVDFFNEITGMKITWDLLLSSNGSGKEL